MTEINEVRPAGGRPVYRKADLMNMESTALKGLLRERTHHNIEVPLYTTLLKWKEKPIPTFGLQAQLVYDAWHERGLPEEGPDMEWVKEHLEIAKKIREGQKVDLDDYIPEPFTETELDVVKKLLYSRRSCRDWLAKPVPDWMIDQILEAGRAAPIGCNLGEVRFIVIVDPEEAKMVWSDISTKNAVLIVICYDKRIPAAVGQDTLVPQNAGFDCAAAADHMLLMAHALGLGACWLSKTTRCDIAEDSGEKFKELYGLPDYIEPACHIAVGWPAIMPLKSKRTSLVEMIIRRNKQQ